MGEGIVRAAFATDDKKSVNAEFGRARHFMVFKVSGEDSVLERVLDFSGGNAGAGHEPRIAGLAGCAMLFVPKPVDDDAVLGLIRSHIFVTKLPRAEAIDSVISRLQVTLRRGVYPRWLRKAMLEAPEEPQPEEGGETE